MLSSVCLVFDAYEKIAEVSIEDSIKSELSGDFERLMLAVGKTLKAPLHDNISNVRLFIYHMALFLVFITVQCIRSVPMFFARRLYKSMKVNIL